MVRRTVVGDVELPQPEEIASAGKAVVEFGGIEQAGPSFEARVFLNNPEAGPDTPLTEECGYAGTFHVYGYGLKEPDAGPADSAGEARLPMRRQVEATAAVARAARVGRSATVTVVAVPLGGRPVDAAGELEPLPVGEVKIRAARP